MTYNFCIYTVSSVSLAEYLWTLNAFTITYNLTYPNIYLRYVRRTLWYEPIRRRLENIRWRPYEDELYILDEEKEVPEEFEGSPSKWCIDMKRRKLICQHPEGRSKILHPAEQGCPVPLHCLTSRRRTVRTHEDGSRSTVKGDWRKPKTSAEECIPTRSWVGYTEFTFKEKFEPEKYINAWMVKRSSDEVREEDITEAEWPKWRETDGSEWGKVAQTGAVIALREEESELIEKQLKEAGLTNRILPSRMVRRWKPSEQPGVPHHGSQDGASEETEILIC